MVIENGGIMILECTSRKTWNMFSKFLDLVVKWLRLNCDRHLKFIVHFNDLCNHKTRVQSTLVHLQRSMEVDGERENKQSKSNKETRNFKELKRSA